MEEDQNISDELLFDYIDGLLPNTDQKRLKDQMQYSQISNRLTDLEKVHSILNNHFVSELPSPDFSKRVLQQISELNRASVPMNTIPTLILLFTVIVIMLAGAMVVYSGIPQIDVQLSTTILDAHFDKLFFGTLFLLLMTSLWFVDKVWIQRWFRKEFEY